MKKEPIEKAIVFELQGHINIRDGLGDNVVTKRLFKNAALIRMFGSHLTPTASDAPFGSDCQECEQKNYGECDGCELNPAHQ